MAETRSPTFWVLSPRDSKISMEKNKRKKSPDVAMWPSHAHTPCIHNHMQVKIIHTKQMEAEQERKGQRKKEKGRKEIREGSYSSN